MKRLAGILMAWILLLTPAMSLADLTILQNRADIAPALAAYAKEYTARTGVKVKVVTVAGAGYEDALRRSMNSGSPADIFVIDSYSQRDRYAHLLAPLDGAAWVDATRSELKSGDTVVGFPVALEGYGLVANLSLLEKAGIDPSSLTNVSAFRRALESLEGQKDALGLTHVIALSAHPTAGPARQLGEMGFNLYLSGGLGWKDTAAVDRALQGDVSISRFRAYCSYLELLFQYSPRERLGTDTWEKPIEDFFNGKAAFYVGDTRGDLVYNALQVPFPMGFIPAAYLMGDTGGVVADAVSWYVCRNGNHLDQAKAFLNDLAMTENGLQYMMLRAHLTPAFTHADPPETAPLSRSLLSWYRSGKVFRNWMPAMPTQFRTASMGELTHMLATGTVDADGFEKLMRQAVAGIPGMER